MFGLAIGFLSPWLLMGLLALPVIWWLLRLTPPRPQEEVFPPAGILEKLIKPEETPAKSPWWLTLLRLMMTALVICAMAGPILNPQESLLEGEGPVLIVIDDGWAAAGNWDERREVALTLAAQAREAGRTVILESTTNSTPWDGRPVSAEEAIKLLEAAQNQPLKPNHKNTATRILTNAIQAKPGHIAWLSDGLSRSDTSNLIAALKTVNTGRSLYLPPANELVIIDAVQNLPAKLRGTLVRGNTNEAREISITGRDLKGVVLARRKIMFENGVSETEFAFDEPVELRNQIARLELDDINNAGAVQLLDESNQRRLVGLISGEKHDQSQPLLSPLYYISKALEPFSDLRRSDDANVAASVPQLLAQGVSAIVLADIGLLPEEAADTLGEWVSKGGMLIRFAGPRLAVSPDRRLLPVDIRPGDRSLGGALSWETPKPVAPFELQSPFSGIDAPREVVVNKQVLALQESDLESKTWATLEDGTPLVTAEQRDHGWIVLFHVSSDARWSNLPLSGTFVEMLRRVVNLSKSTGRPITEREEISLSPLRLLDGKGNFVAPGISVKPLTLSAEHEPTVSLENPPGFYGTEDGFTALNLFTGQTKLALLNPEDLGPGFNRQSYLGESPFDLKPWLLLVAAILLALDCLAVFWMGGALRLRQLHPRSPTPAIIVLLGIGAMLLSTGITHAQENEIDFSAALRTRLAYVITGVKSVDNLSAAGMRGLTYFLSNRTALEPGEPVGLDMSTDELAFYSLIYWPIDPQAAIPDAATMARVDAYMKEGGSILFDTRDQISGVFGGTSASPAALSLRQILSNLDIPPLEPVPSDHVLTKSFFLIDSFPGRFSGGDLWIEASQKSAEQDGRPARAGDGVSSILITSNDFAGAWAVDRNLRPLLPTVPPDPIQRNYAFRGGVNLMMYALTGNYKADQVHLPALLERLGQ